VTGAARGIGAESARQLAARGARIACVGLEADELAKVAQSCGNDSLWFEADVTDSDAVDRAVAGTIEATGGIDVVIANAGIAAPGAVRDTAPEAWQRVLRVNLFGVYNAVHACLPSVIERGGYVLPVASLAALTPSFPGFSSYATSKAGIEAFAASLRPEVNHLGVDVGVAYFSFIATDMVRGGDAESPTFKYLREQLKGPGSKTHPLPQAVHAIVRGVEARARVVAYPGWVKAARVLRGLMAPALEKEMLDAAPQGMALLEAERQRTGTSHAVGAGGAADALAVDREAAPK
jgi:NAD(P)-dependent dehydrogenase (short-subunit alcohol dehydrogenase family)